MKSRARLSPARLLRAAAPACLVLTACDPMAGPPPAAPVRYHAPPLDTRRSVTPKPEASRWLTAWRSLREEIEPLREKLEGLQAFHANTQFDSFLQLDPETMDKDQLSTMFHFLQRGYFTVQRRLLIDLLNRRLDRGDDAVPETEGPPMLKDRFIAAMHRDELRMLDIETAIEYYSEAGNADIQLPNSLTDAEHEELLSTVNRMVEKTRAEVVAMDAEIKSLKARIYPDDPMEDLDLPVPEPVALPAPPETAPVPVSGPEEEEEAVPTTIFPTGANEPVEEMEPPEAEEEREYSSDPGDPPLPE